MNKKYLKFKEVPNEGKKTKRFIILNLQGETLGSIYWKGSWRKYIYFTIKAEYDTKCLTEIINFINNLMNERKGV